MPKELLVSASDRETRVAVLEEGRVAEVQIERRKQRGTVGNIYKGRVTRVLPGMQSAFVDVGLEKDAFLYVADVGEEVDDFDAFGERRRRGDARGARRRRPRARPPSGRRRERLPKPILPSIDELLREGQELVVQVTKDQIAHKGVRVTTHVTLPGRTLVYMPTIDHVGVSRRIENEDERNRLKDILTTSRRVPAGTSCARRARGARRRSSRPTAAISRSSGSRSARRASARARRRSSTATSTSRSAPRATSSARTSRRSGWTTTRSTSASSSSSTRCSPSLVSKVKLFRKSAPLFEEYGVEAEIENALKSKVWLKSGGYIVINQTEALVAIDVNTGKFVGKKRLEDTVVKTNLEAVQEIVRQIRLRDLGGLLVVDFIDMEEEEHRQELVTALEAELKKDRSKNRMLPVSEFGLVEITRKRQRQSLERALTMPCPYCAGSGRTKSVPTIVLEIRREILKRVEVGRGALARPARPPRDLPRARGRGAPPRRGARGADRHADPRPERRAPAPRAVRHRPRGVGGPGRLFGATRLACGVRSEAKRTLLLRPPRGGLFFGPASVRARGHRHVGAVACLLAGGPPSFTTP